MGCGNTATGRISYSRQMMATHLKPTKVGFALRCREFIRPPEKKKRVPKNNSAGSHPRCRIYSTVTVTVNVSFGVGVTFVSHGRRYTSVSVVCPFANALN